MTRELIANMLGVSREGLMEAVENLQKAGLIEYRHGHITVLDRADLEARVCECYAVVRNEFDRLLPEAPISKSVANEMRSDSVKRDGKDAVKETQELLVTDA